MKSCCCYYFSVIVADNVDATFELRAFELVKEMIVAAAVVVVDFEIE